MSMSMSEVTMLNDYVLKMMHLGASLLNQKVLSMLGYLPQSGLGIQQRDGALSETHGTQPQSVWIIGRQRQRRV